MDGDGVFQDKEVVIFGNTGGNGNNCAIDSTGGFLYAGTPTGVSRWSWPGGPDGGGSPDPVVVNEPNTGHPYHTVHVYDGFLYVHSGSLGNEEDSSSPAYDDNRALLRRFDLSRLDPATPLDWTTGEVVAVGLRNMVGYTRNAAGRIYGVVNGIDGVTYQAQDVHEDNPGEQVVLVAPGKRYGYPFCYTAQRIVANGQLIPAGTQDYNEGFASGLNDAWCAANSDPPVTFLQAHSAPLDILFFDTQPQGALAERWRGGAFITMHGSAYRTQPTGYKVVWMPFNADGSAAMPVSTATSTTFPYEVVFGGGTSSGPVDGRWNWSTSTVPGEVPSPVGVAIGPIDGALYISSNAGGYLYRVGLGKD